MKTKPWMTLAAGLVAALALVAQPATADHDGEKKVKIKKIVRCEDGDCQETVERLGEGEALELGDVGGRRVEIRKVVCDGEDCPEHEGHHWMHHGAAMAGGSYLGVGLSDLTPELRVHFGAPEDAGVLVAKVVDGSPAQRAGIRVGDVVTSADGETIASGSQLAHKVRRSEEGTALTLELVREGSAQTVIATVEAPPSRGELAGGERRMRKVIVECDDDEADCGAGAKLAGMEAYDCGSPECEVQVQCDDGECTCVVNGEAADCADIPGVPSRR